LESNRPVRRCGVKARQWHTFVLRSNSIFTNAVYGPRQTAYSAEVQILGRLKSCQSVPMKGPIADSGEPTLAYRDAAGRDQTLPLDRVHNQDLALAGPWRTFRWHRGQPHYSGMYWSATMGAHVVYESRLELARLLLADFDRAVVTIVAQPFQLSARIDGRIRRHVPDFLLRDGTGAGTVVDVKPAGLLAEPTVARTLAWAGELIEARGWRFEVWSGCDGVLLTNVRFLAGYRRSWLFSEDLLNEVLAAVGDGDTIAAVERRLAPRRQARTVRPALLHLLWRGEFTADLHQVLGGTTTLRRPRERAA